MGDQLLWMGRNNLKDLEELAERIAVPSVRDLADRLHVFGAHTNSNLGRLVYLCHVLAVALLGMATSPQQDQEAFFSELDAVRDFIFDARATIKRLHPDLKQQ
jgi:hypothetical protein